MSDLVLPPLFTACDVAGQGDPFALACARAAEGCEAGLTLYDLAPERMRAALVLAPEVPLGQAMAMLPLCAAGFQNALGVLGPPELSVLLDWDGGVRINGGRAGYLCAAAASRDPAAVPDWMVVALSLDLWPGPDATGEAGDTPDATALFLEGCAEVAPDHLLEAWIRHTLVGLNRWESEGNAPLHRDWTGLAHGIGKPAEVQGQTGTFTGIDENFAMLMKQGDTTRLIPLTHLLRDPTKDMP